MVLKNQKINTKIIIPMKIRILRFVKSIRGKISIKVYILFEKIVILRSFFEIVLLKMTFLDSWLNWIEHLTTDQEVVGSTPAEFTRRRGISSVG